MDVISHRRALHRIPELQMELPQTMAYLRDALSELPCRVFAPMESALCAYFDFGAQQTLAFRADCDALAIQELGDKPYRSCYDGRMHACGHDGHMAILLELARRLSQGEKAKRNVLLLFQPGEESPGGARFLCETGVLEQYNVKTIFGLHLWPGLPAGCVFTRPGELMSRASELNVDIYGKSAHVANAAAGIDAVAAGAEFFRRAMALEAGIPSQYYRLLKFGKFQSGTIRNALSAHTRLEGSLRAFQDAVFEELKEGLFVIGRELEQEMGCRVEISLTEGYPAVMNPESLTRQVMELTHCRELEKPSMTAEDFAFYQKRTEGVFFFLGLGDSPALHAANFDFDESILVKGADFFENLARNLP